MRCPVHVAQDMKPQAVQSCRIKLSGRGLRLEEVDQELRNRNLVIVRCPVESCPRVDYVVVAKVEVHYCGRCGRESDAPSYRQVIGDHTCTRCTEKRRRYWKERRERKNA